MKVEVINLGGGLKRLVLEPQCSCESNVPTSVVDRIMRDVISRENAQRPCVVNQRPWVNRPCVAPKAPWSSANMSTKRRIEEAWRDTPNEPHGIDIHVDRPLRENFWSHHEWADAMAKYRTLEDVAKDCDWPCKEPMKGTTVEVWGRPAVHPRFDVGVQTFDGDDDLSWMWPEW